MQWMPQCPGYMQEGLSAPQKSERRPFLELLAFGSANPCTEDRFDSGSCTTYYGKALAVLRAGSAAGQMVVSVSGNGLESQRVSLDII